MELSSDLSNLNDILKFYDDKLSDHEENLELGGKNIERANVEQAAYFAYYDQIRAELEFAVKRADILRQVAFIEAWKRIEAKATKAYSDRTMEKMAEVDKIYLKTHLAVLELEERLRTAKMIMDSLEKRGFAINNVVKINLAALRDISIYE